MLDNLNDDRNEQVRKKQNKKHCNPIMMKKKN